MSFLVDFALLRRNRQARYLLLGQLLSFFAYMVTNVALPYQIYQQTHATLMVGLLSLCQLLPLLVTALLGGVMADQHNRRQLILWSSAVLIAGYALLLWNTAQPTPHLSLLFIGAAVMSATGGFYRPALNGLMQQVIAKSDFAAASALSALNVNFCAIAGPALGGLLLAHVGITTTLIIAASSVLLSLIAYGLMTPVKNAATPNTDTVRTRLLEGFRYAASRQELLGTYFVDFIAMIFGMPMALFPAIAESFGGASVLGLFYAAPATGAFLLAIFSGWTTRIKRQGVAITVAAGLWGASIIVFGLMQQLWVALLFLMLAGAFDEISAIFRSLLWNNTIPHALRGRLSGIEMISYLSGPRLGDTEAGLVAAAFGVGASIVSGGILCVIGVGICAYCLPTFWRYRADANEANS